MSWRPTAATLFLLLVFGAPLFGIIISLVATIGQQLQQGVNIVKSINPQLPPQVQSSEEYQKYKQQESILIKILDYIVGLLTNKYSIAALIAAGIIYTTYELHARPQTI